MLSLQTAQCEVLGIDLGKPFDLKYARKVRLRTMGLADAVPSMEVEYKLTDYAVTGAFETSFVTFLADNDALNGRDFPRDSIFRTMDIRFNEIPSDASTDLFGVLYNAELEIEVTNDESERPRR